MIKLSQRKKIDKEKILAILSDLGVGRGQIVGKEYVARCPFHDDRHPSFSINLETGLWCCFAEGLGGKIEDLLSRISGETVKFFDFPEAKFFEKREEKEETLNELKEFPFMRNFVPGWIFDRGFKSEYLKKYECSFDEQTGSLVIPVYHLDGKIVGVIKRQPNGRIPRYLYSKGFRKSKVLFGGYNIAEDVKDFLCIVEGPLDCIWLIQNGFPAVAILGAHISTEQCNLLIDNFKCGEIVICTDNDKTGSIASDEIERRIKKYYQISRINLPAGVKDVQDVRDPEILRYIIQKRGMIA